MKSSGVIRKIDELGRIVLPKEIRRNLGIRDGENIEIFVDNDSIILKKYSKIKGYNEIVNSICDIVKSVYHLNLIVTDRDKVIYSTVESYLNQNIDDNLINLIQSRDSINNTFSTYSLGDKVLKGYFSILPIISSSDPLGLIMIYDDKEIREEHYNILKLITSIIINKVDVS